MTWLEQTIEQQRTMLARYLRSALQSLAAECAAQWRDPAALDQALSHALADMPLCGLLYAINTEGTQVSSNVMPHRVDRARLGQNLAARPFLNNALPYLGFILSEVYVSKIGRRPCITALQAISGSAGMLGFVAADFDLRDLPLLEQTGYGQAGWRQIKGDPAIRGTLFQQQCARSAMDEHMDDVISIMEELMCERGVFHGKLHFSSSRGTLWLTDDPCRYRLHVLEEILNPAVCLAYPKRDYASEAIVAQQLVRPVFERFRVLRDADENIYLRSGSLNVINGLVGLTFSCDGSHYMPAREFLEKDDSFWFGIPQ
jgi:hypothetical protein